MPRPEPTLAHRNRLRRFELVAGQCRSTSRSSSLSIGPGASATRVVFVREGGQIHLAGPAGTAVDRWPAVVARRDHQGSHRRHSQQSNPGAAARSRHRRRSLDRRVRAGRRDAAARILAATTFHGPVGRDRRLRRAGEHPPAPVRAAPGTCSPCWTRSAPVRSVSSARIAIDESTRRLLRATCRPASGSIPCSAVPVRA